MILSQGCLDLRRREKFFELGLDRFLDRHSCICRDSRRAQVVVALKHLTCHDTAVVREDFERHVVAEARIEVGI